MRISNTISVPFTDQVKLASGMLLIGQGRTADSPSLADNDFFSDFPLIKAVDYV